MSVIARCEIQTIHRAADPPTDYTMNTVYFSTEGAVADADFKELTDALSATWKHGATLGSWGPYDQRSHTVKAYNMADPKPRPARGVTTYVAGFPTSGTIDPRQIALCLSYYSGRNLPRQRGRIYVGPFDDGWTGGEKERPGASQMNSILDLGARLYNTGTALSPGWTHIVFSTHTPTTPLAVTDYWVNDVWDVHRSRSPKESTRVRLHP